MFAILSFFILSLTLFAFYLNLNIDIYQAVSCQAVLQSQWLLRSFFSYIHYIVAIIQLGSCFSWLN